MIVQAIAGGQCNQKVSHSISQKSGREAMRNLMSG
jgi:hypothetical protein